MTMRKAKLETFDSVWDALADTPEEAANLRVRAELMGRITRIIEDRAWTQAEAAAKCNITQPRINDLLRGRISRFSLDALVNVVVALGMRVKLELHPMRGSERPRKRGAKAARRREPRRTVGRSAAVRRSHR